MTQTTRPRNWAVGAPKITAEQIAEIRRAYANGATREELTEQFNLSGSTIWHLTRGYRMAVSPTETEAYRAAIDALEQIRRYLEQVIVDASNEAMIAHCLNIADIVDDALAARPPAPDTK